MKIPTHHENWLKNHPDRSSEWLKSMIGAGFDIHHSDGNHLNNDPDNLVLIEHSDHMRLHGFRMDRMKKMPFGYKKRAGVRPNGIKGRIIYSDCGNFYIKLDKFERAKNIMHLALNGSIVYSRRLKRVS